MKKALSVFFALALVVACVWVCSTDAHAATEGDYTYTVSDGEAAITDYSGSGGNVTIPATLGGYPVTTIEWYAFSDCDSLTSVTIPGSVKTIGEDAFAGCDSLTSVTIPNSVTTIGDGAFSDCDSLTSVTMGNSVTTIGDWAFYDCDSLTSVTIPNSVTTIGDSAFAGCYSLTSVTIPNSVKTIGNSAFSFCASLTSVTIPNSVTTIGAESFYGCSSLTSVTMGNSVTTIGWYAFSYCASLTKINVSSNNAYYSNDSKGVLFNKNKTTLIQAPGAISGSYTIPNSVTTISEDAFAGCYSLTSVTMGDSVKTIGDGAFWDCVGLTSVTMGSGVTTIGEHAFYDCASLNSVFIPLSVENISWGAFDGCDSLQSVYYAGNESQWESISIEGFNDALTGASRYYNQFPDVKTNAWYYNAVQFAVKNSYFSGNGDGTFGAGNDITRQDFVVVMSRIAKADLSKYNGKTNFTDVPSNAYYAKAIHWATANGIISGYNATKFGVGDKLTREQLVTILYRYAAKKGVNVTPTAAAQAKLNAYSDAGKVNSAMKNQVAWALDKKVISGMTSTTVGPQGKATRAQVAAILLNISSYKVIPGI